MKSGEKKLLVLGLGNLLMGDEGVGVHVIQQLEQQKLPDCVECLDGGTGCFYLLEPMQDADRIILIDAAAFDDRPGSIRVVSPTYAADYPRTLTPHDIGLKDLLDSFHLLGKRPDIRLIAITIDPHQQLHIGLSPKVSQAASRAMDLALHEIALFSSETQALAE